MTKILDQETIDSDWTEVSRTPVSDAVVVFPAAGKYTHTYAVLLEEVLLTRKINGVTEIYTKYEFANDPLYPDDDFSPRLAFEVAIPALKEIRSVICRKRNKTDNDTE